MSMHRDKLLDEGYNLLDLLESEDKKIWVDTFIKCGRSSVTDNTS